MRTITVIASLLTASALALPAFAQPGGTDASPRPFPAQHAKQGQKGERILQALRQNGSPPAASGSPLDRPQDPPPDPPGTPRNPG